MAPRTKKTPAEAEAPVDPAGLDPVKRLAVAKTEAAALKEWKRDGSKGDQPATPVLEFLNSADYATRRAQTKTAKAEGNRSDGAKRAWETRRANAAAKAPAAPKPEAAKPAAKAPAKKAPAKPETPTAKQIGVEAAASKSADQRRTRRGSLPAGTAAAAKSARPRVDLRPTAKSA